MTRRAYIFTLVSLLSLSAMAQTSRELLSEIVQKNDEYQATHSPLCDTSKENVDYFLDNMEVYRLTGKAEYYEYCDTWCRHNKWDCQGGDSACLEVYRQMDVLVPAPYKVAHAKGYIYTPHSDSWMAQACQRVRQMDQSDRQLTLTITNPSADNRADVVELSSERVFADLNIAGGRQMVIRDGDGVEVAYQLTYDGLLLVQAFVRPQGNASFTISVGTPKDFRLDVNGRKYPNREDDLAFENDKCAWRFYGPKMHLQGVTGFDVFTKNVTYPIQDQLYNSELSSYVLHEELKQAGREREWADIHRNHYTYHRNRGEGMDAYSVGRTLGAGAPALIVDDEMLMPDVYERADILDNGPLRFTVRETMYPQGGIVETRLIALDKGTHLARCEVSYDGLTQATPVCSGIVIHESNPKYVANQPEGYIAYADAMDTPQGQNGELYLACLYTEGDVSLERKSADGAPHIVGRTTYSPERPFVYYFGSAWSLYDVPTMSVWEALLAYYSRNMKKPLILEY